MVNNMSHVKDRAEDKAGVGHWDDTYACWKTGVFDPHSNGIRYLARRKWHALFTRMFHVHAPEKGKLIEIGCGGSRYLPYLANEFNFEVSGIDYSERGCALAEKNLALAGVKGSIYYGDLFSPPQELIGAFDVAVSFGVVEHFSDTTNCIECIARLLRPGGLIFTSVPNMTGLPGLAQKYLGPDIFNKHQPLSKDLLVDAHLSSGLTVLEAGFLEFMNFGVVTIGRSDSAVMQQSLKKLLHKGLLGFTLGVWTVETIWGSFKGNPLISPYVYCIAMVDI